MTELTLVPFPGSRSASPDLVRSGRSSPGWDDLINTSMSPGLSRIHSESSIASIRRSLTKEAPTKPIESTLASNRRVVLEVIGQLFDGNLLSRDETAECIRLATCVGQDETVKAMRDLVQARKTLEGKAQFLKMFLAGRQKSSDQTPATASTQQSPIWFSASNTITPSNELEQTPLVQLQPPFFTPSPAEEHMQPPMRRPTAVRGKQLISNEDGNAPPVPTSTPVSTPPYGLRGSFGFPAVSLSPFLFAPLKPPRFN